MFLSRVAASGSSQQVKSTGSWDADIDLKGRTLSTEQMLSSIEIPYGTRIRIANGTLEPCQLAAASGWGRLLTCN
jgi:hypothetical protein